MANATTHAAKFDSNISFIDRLEKALAERKRRKDAAWGDTYSPAVQVGICLVLALPLVSAVFL